MDVRIGADESADNGFLGALFADEGAALVHMARWYVDDKTAAEDLVQEAFIRLSRHIHRLRDPSKATAYLRRTVINLARDHNRRGFVSFRHRPPADPDEPSTEEIADGRAARAEVIEALRALPMRQRECLTLHYYYDLGVAATAAALGLSENSVKTHLRRGRKALASALEDTR
ncbi:RNA polymerase sigma-70 factor (ECF subfamily) [Nocardioides luteus]|uniref:RNA polymerase sigma factor n=1 Tax=Nocardioides luteus TaxID=1844 RepID=A0ABQ5SX49_9ACTN|nr:sigma-70 family RNA polymerase sigma factor [Nocardioides luteus]MDR7312298.1 RNA polymerase sigma-70 factor (ECF subfamily) [Nocardioides luteus]GGR57532.1 RNA polymerase sigma factor [Nocardioides luteus]GLJ68544.1 RNA polymerase sigma factor [Nocardioides luteus]